MESNKNVQNVGDVTLNNISSTLQASTGDRLLHELSPIKNPLILKTLFDLCPPKQLVPLRLVCKDFYTHSLASWRSSIRIFFHGDVIYIDAEVFWKCKMFWNIVSDSGPADTRSTLLRKFLNYVQDPKYDCKGKPYTRFYLKEWDFKGQNKAVQEFFTTCGPYITHLEMDGTSFYDTEIFRKMIFTTFPKLKRLVLKDSYWSENPVVEGKEYEVPSEGEHDCLKELHIDMDHNRETLPISWLDLLSHFPNLEKLGLENENNDDEVVKMLEAVKIIRKKHRTKLSLKHLEILLSYKYCQETVPPAVCELLHDLNLPLESLTMDFGVEPGENIMKDILETHSKTLRKINVCRGYEAVPYSDFPFGVNLNALQEITFSDRLSLNLHFLKYTPNLKKLSFFNPRDNSTKCSEIVKNTFLFDMEQEQFQLRSLEELRFDLSCSENDLKKLTSWLPNVKKLRMPLDDNKFHIVCKNWKDVEEIEILGLQITDFGITGKSFPCKNEVTKLEEPANITHLLKLRSFIMNSHSILPSELTDTSAFHGFLLCPKLSVLKIPSEMSDKARNALKEKIPDCNINRIWDYPEEGYPEQRLAHIMTNV